MATDMATSVATNMAPNYRAVGAVASGSAQVNTDRLKPRYCQEAFPVGNEIVGMSAVEPFLQLLRDYSGVPADQIEKHVRAVRDKAYAIYPYPCLGSWRFLDLYVRLAPWYAGVLSQVRDAGATLVDVGCGLGQVLRQLATDGCPPDQLTGADLRDDFVRLGFELFLDRDRAFGRGARFVFGNLLDAADGGDPALRALDGSADIVHAASLFHLWGWDDQVRAGVRVVRFFRARPAPGTTQMVVGRQRGLHAPPPPPPPGEEEHASRALPRFRHSPETWQLLWDEVGHQTDTEWKVEAELRDIDISQRNREDPVRTMLLFEVRRFR